MRDKRFDRSRFTIIEWLIILTIIGIILGIVINSQIYG